MFKKFSDLFESIESCFASSIPDNLCRPDNKHGHIEWDYKKLRKYIQDGRLAPFLPGSESSQPSKEQRALVPVLNKVLRKKKQPLSPEDIACLSEVTEECPICMLNYQLLNSSHCCGARICTECYLQVQASQITKRTLPACPFCKVPGYLAKFTGAKTSVDHQRDRVDEQKFIEARVREREEERRQDKEREIQREQRRQTEQASEDNTAGAASGRVRSGSSTPCAFARHDTLSSSETEHLHHPDSSDACARSPLQRRSRTPSNSSRAEPDQEGSMASQSEPPRRSRPITRRSEVGTLSRYRLGDYLPCEIADYSVSLHDINALMLERAVYESLAAPSTANQEPAAGSSSSDVIRGSVRRRNPPRLPNRFASKYNFRMHPMQSQP